MGDTELLYSVLAVGVYALYLLILFIVMGAAANGPHRTLAPNIFQ